MTKRDPETVEPGTRRWIANILVVGGMVVVGVLGVVVIFVAEKRHEAAQLVLTSVLPLVGTWIGTVLAFYFAKDNFESASRAARETLGVEEKLKSILVTKVMIPVARIDAFKLGTSVDLPAIPGGASARKVAVPADADEILISDALDYMAAKKRNRLPVFDAGGICLSVIHVSTLHRFIANMVCSSVASSPAPSTQKLKNLRVNDPDSHKAILAWASVSESASLADAKFAMETTPNSIDVMVTTNGRSDGVVVGWLTNIEIAQQSRA